jgi:hypothetical protein
MEKSFHSEADIIISYLQTPEEKSIKQGTA